MDVERHPGPGSWYTFGHPHMCGYFRTALHSVFTSKQELIPVNENETKVTIDVKDGFNKM